MMQRIHTGEPFNCTYLKRDGTLAEFVGLRKPEKEEGAATPFNGGDKRASRPLQNYLSLVPFQTINNEVRELYTRLIQTFNDEQIVL